MNKTKEFLKLINRKDLPSMDEIAGDEFLFNSYLAIFAEDAPSEADRRSLARDISFERYREAGRREARLNRT